MTLEYDNIFDLIDKDSAASMKFRADLLILIRDHYRSNFETQHEFSKVVDLPQPRVSKMLAGKVGLFSCDALIDVLFKLGINIGVEVRK